MIEDAFDDSTFERISRERFGLDLEISQVILREAEVGNAAMATVFLTNKKQLFVYIHGNSKLLLSDIKKIISRMCLKIDTFIPPNGRKDYFDAIGRKKFCEVFPGRTQVNDQDIIYYKTLAPYNPALVLISEVKDGVIYKYDSDSRTNWRPAVKFAYRRIKTS